MNDSLDDNSLVKIRDIILTHTGILFDELHVNDLVRHISSACTDLKISKKSCIEQIEDSSFLSIFLEILVNYITIGETYFFRDKNLFIYLRDILLPDLIQKRRRENKLYLRFWSAACSSGEEPYSLAMLLRYLLIDIDDWDIFLLATDINHNILNRAREGIYSRWSFRNDPIIPTDLYFSKILDNQVKLDDIIRNMVRFEKVNLVRDTSFSHGFGPSSLDLVLCRNVLMYFSQDKSHEVVTHLVNSLRIGGYLIVSPQEIGIIQGQDTRIVHEGSVFLHERVIPGAGAGRKDSSCSSPGKDVTSEFSLSSETIDAEDIEDFGYDDKSHEDIFKNWTKPEINLPGADIQEDENKEINQQIIEDRPNEAIQIINNSETDNFLQEIMEMEGAIRSYAGNGEYEKALGWSDRLIAIDVLNPRPYLLKAAVFDEQGLYEHSLQLLRQSLYASHDYLPAHLAIAGIYSKTGKPDLARHHYKLAIGILETKDEDIILEETEGIPAQKMKDMINQLLEG